MIGIYIVTKNMTVAKHTKGRAGLASREPPESAMRLHSCFGEMNIRPRLVRSI